MPAAKDRPVLDLALSAGEVVGDFLSEDGLISGIPIISTAFKTVKALDSFRDRLFMARLIAFIEGADEMSPEDRIALGKKLDSPDGKRVGETLLLVLEKVTDLDKPRLLGLLLRRFAEGRINARELRYLATAIDLSFADDLKEFLGEDTGTCRTPSLEGYRERLVVTGLIRSLSGDTIDSMGMTRFDATRLGVLLHDIAAGEWVR
jgi:hypothetical protein